jgi:tetratricopeptide (TPR) repeat protein
MGKVYRRSGEYNQGIAVMEKAIPLVAGDLRAKYQLEMARNLFEAGRINEAINIGEMALATVDNQAWQEELRGWIAQSR